MSYTTYGGKETLLLGKLDLVDNKIREIRNLLFEKCSLYGDKTRGGLQPLSEKGRIEKQIEVDLLIEDIKDIIEDL